MSASSYTNVVEALYVAYFGRPADVAGLNALATQLALADTAHTGTTIAGLAAEAPNVPAINTLVNSFGNSAESQSLYGSGNSTSFVTAIYQDLLGRAPDSTGLNFWVNALNTGTVAKGEAALQIMSAALQNTSAQGQIDATTINNKIAAASYYTGSMAADTTGDDVEAYVGASAAATARGLLSTVNNGTTVNGTQFETNVALTIQNVDLQTNLTHIYSDNLPAHTAGAGPGAAPGFNLHTNATFDGMPELSVINGLLAGDGFTFNEGSPIPILRSLVNVTAAEATATAAIYGHSTVTLADYFTAAIEQAAAPHRVAEFTYGGNTYLFQELSQGIEYGTLVEIPGIHTVGLYPFGGDGGSFRLIS